MTGVTGSAAPSVTVPLGSFNLSGGVKVLVILANAMARRGWRVVFLVPDFAARSPFPLDRSIGVTVVGAGPSWLPHPFRQLVYYARLATRAARGTDVCLANYFPTALCAFLSRMLGGRGRIVYYAQGHEAMSHGLIAEANPLSRRLRWALARLSYRLPVQIVCVSSWARERIGRPDAAVAHAAALDLDIFRPRRAATTKPTVVVGTVGRAAETKGYRYFLDAVARLRRETDVVFLVASPRAGEVPLPREFPAEAIHATTEDAMAEFYNRCDVFVLPSLFEGFPLPPLEAMACGCAVVLTACGGPADYAENERNAIVVPPADAPALAAALARVIADAELRRRLAEAGPPTAARFARDRMADAFLALVAAR